MWFTRGRRAATILPAGITSALRVSTIPTGVADALLPLLVCDTSSVRAAAVAELDHPDGFAGVCGPPSWERGSPGWLALLLDKAPTS